MNYDDRYKGAFQAFIDEVTHDIARKKGGSTKYAAAESELARVLGCSEASIQKYRRGASTPRRPFDAIEAILDFCVTEYAMDVAWVKERLGMVHHPNEGEILEALFPEGVGLRAAGGAGRGFSLDAAGGARAEGAPEGALRLTDPYYIEREVDLHLRQEVLAWGTTITIRAPRQTGKSSLLVRGLNYARQHGMRYTLLDMQGVGEDNLRTKDHFLHFLVRHIFRELGLGLEIVEQEWQSTDTPNNKLTYLIEDYLLSETDERVILALDEADRLMNTPFYQDFFGLMRSWHNKRPLNESWNQLNMILVISTEPHLLIRDVHQSPFNVGSEFYVNDFERGHVEELNRRYEHLLNEAEIGELMGLINGHPYLVRQAFYNIVTKKWSLPQLIEVAQNDTTGPFGKHLRRLYDLLQWDDRLKRALNEVIEEGHCRSEAVFFHLQQAGLVSGVKEKCRCRCQLYEAYFKDKFGW